MNNKNYYEINLPLKRIVKGLPHPKLPAEGLMNHDPEALTPFQLECTGKFQNSIKIEHEAYLSQHPEISALLELFISKSITSRKTTDHAMAAGKFFTRTVSDLDYDVRERLGVTLNGPYSGDQTFPYQFIDYQLMNDIRKVKDIYFPKPDLESTESSMSTVNTKSSSFMSQRTSATTLPTPEPIPIPEPTLYEICFGFVEFCVLKAVYLRVTEGMLKYDTAYVELMKCVEEAMEIPVVVIREDIAELFYNAYQKFEINILEKEREAAKIAWEKRMRKIQKKTVRRQINFKGYETPPSSKSTLSSHPSYLLPPPKTCECHPQFVYNRYPKDRFGNYRPIENPNVEIGNATLTPAFSLEDLATEDETQTAEKSAKTTAVSSSK